MSDLSKSQNIKCGESVSISIVNLKMATEKDERITVYVRIKPESEADAPRKCATTVMDVVSDKELVVHQQSQDRISKRFTFDRVFGPSSSQVDVYEAIVSPLLKQVIAGYNCTVFAYGQTGSGKTYTMEGGRVDDLNMHWRSDTSVGVIPRCFSQLFEELRLLENQRYTVRVNFLELYNEELFDLLTSDGNVTSRIKLYEDVTRKGSVIIHGLEEVVVRDQFEIYKILEKGSARRQVAATLMNVNSSRSHTVFSIIIQTKENSRDGEEELFKTAQLNLVDLAGNESIGKHGSHDKKAREAKSINQSLLTLGRVITALVEKAPHVPYRESKLTRLLQDSLGGQTKTSIIATVSSVNFDETLLTLEYACRAKNITNYPQINEILCRKALLREYTKEIERLKKDLAATRERNGVYLSLGSYDAVRTLIDRQRIEIKETKDHCKALEKLIQNKQEMCHDLQSQCDAQVSELAQSKSELEKMNRLLRSKKDVLQRTENDIKQQKSLVERYVKTEEILHDQAQVLLNVANEATQDARQLHNKLDRKMKVEEDNGNLRLQIEADFMEQCNNIKDKLAHHQKMINTFLQSIKDEVETCIASQISSMAAAIRSTMQNAIYQQFAECKKLKTIINASYTRYQEAFNVHTRLTIGRVNEENQLLTNIYAKLVLDISDLSRHNESVVQNLRILNENITQKLESASAYAKLAIETVCRNRLEECNYFYKCLNKISQQIDHMSRNETQVMENYTKFGKKMEALLYEFNLLNNCETNYSENINKSHQIEKICNKMYDQTLRKLDANINEQNNIKDFLYVIENGIRSNLDNSINQVQTLNKTTVERKVDFVSDIQERLSSARATLKQYNNNLQFNRKQLQETMIKDQNTVLASSANILKLVENMGLPYVKFLKQQQNKISDFSARTDDKFAICSIELSNWNNNILEELHASKQQLNHFLTETFRCNVSTDVTMPKKYLYPRIFATTSERIIQRFREVRKYADELEEDLDLA